jgi:hypothetical protein
LPAFWFPPKAIFCARFQSLRPDAIVDKDREIPSSGDATDNLSAKK